jgi:colanic acid/amylovoran biosynthesis protein
MSESRTTDRDLRIVLLNAYSTSNRGDLGIVVAMADFLRRCFGHPDIAVLSDYTDQNHEIYGQYRLRALPNIWSVREGSLAAKYWRGLRIVLSQLRTNKEHQGLVAIREADLVLPVGGGYLYSSRRGPLGVGLLGALFHIHLASRLRKPVVAFPMSVGPFGSKLDALLAKRVLSEIKLVCSREPITTRVLDELGLTNVVEVPDIAFLLSPGNPLQLPETGGKLRLGVTVLNWSFAQSVNESVIDEYVARVERIVDRIAAVCPIHVYIFPQVTVGGKDSDLPVSLKLHRLIGEQSSSVVNLEDVWRPEDVIATYSQMDLFLASRMHSAIFAMAGKVPTVGLAYQPKTHGTFAMLGVPERSFDITNFDPGKVATTLLEGLNRPVEVNLESHFKCLEEILKSVTNTHV